MARASDTDLVRDLLAAVGWAVFVGFGIALGLTLGSLGADIASDTGMATFFGLVTGIGTLLVRLAMVAWKHRTLVGSRGAPATRPAPTRSAPQPASVGARSAAAGAARRTPRPARSGNAPQAARTPRAAPSGGPKTASPGASKAKGTQASKSGSGSSKAAGQKRAAPSRATTPSPARKPSGGSRTRKPPASGS